ncbi:MAG: GGDEF domain-containing protein [Candidatus Firestonebacteria bacterium]
MLTPKKDTLIKEVMSRTVITAPKTARVLETCRLMESSRVGSIVVVKDKHPVGIITERDIVNSVAKSGPGILNQPVTAIMKTPVITLHAKQKIKTAVEFMIAKRIRRLPIVDHGNLIGIVTYGDILRAIQKEVADMQMQTEQLKIEVQKDGLTKFYTQKYFKILLEKEVQRVKSYGGFLSLLMVDIDHFKKINDTYGHDAGDFILHKISLLIEHNTRKINVVGRYGGDEIGIIAPISDIEGARRLGERLRQFVDQTRFNYHGKIIKASLSVGVATWDKSIQDGRGLIVKADKALYRAKQEGRNRVSVI